MHPLLNSSIIMPAAVVVLLLVATFIGFSMGSRSSSIYKQELELTRSQGDRRHAEDEAAKERISKSLHDERNARQAAELRIRDLEARPDLQAVHAGQERIAETLATVVRNSNEGFTAIVKAQNEAAREQRDGFSRIIEALAHPKPSSADAAS